MSTAISTAKMTLHAMASIDTARMARYAFGICRDANMADDIVQATLTRIISQLSRNGEFEVDDVEKFLNVGMRNAFRDILRKNRRFESSDEAITSLENVAKDTTEIDPAEMVSAIGFTDTEKRLIELMMGGMETREICEIMEISKEYFWKLSQRIRDKVRDSIQ